MDLLITGATILSMDPARHVLKDAAVAVQGGRIAAIGPATDLPQAAAQVIDARGMVMMPGLIDVHAHAGHGLIKSMGMDRANRWEEICGEVYTTASPPEFWYAEARLAALERLRFGVTCGVSLLGGGDTIMRTDAPDYGEAHCDGVAEVGTRSVVAVGPTRAPHPRSYAGADGVRYPVTFERQLDTCRTLVQRRHGRGRIEIALLYPVLRDEHESGMAPSDYAEATRQAQATRALARDHGLVFTQDGHEKGSIRRAEALGLLDERALLSHAIDLYDDEIEICARTDTKIAHNPSALASVRGRCPAIELIEAGVCVALGSDATAPDRSGDMFRHMQQAMHYHRRHFRDADVLPPGKVLEMATIDAARALGLADRVGSIETGKEADLVLVDMRRPHLYPVNMEPYRMACFANGNDVDTVVIGGEVVLSEGRPTRVDTGRILADAQRGAEAMIERIGAAADLELPKGFWGHARYPAGDT
ncbi:amidohydrolase family protein [Pararhodobacter sp. SW119]|uniref:amidohydrolase family protein n=1 Tax=Pararhodobacter sp. SW119 TaxID=2780075 RepID=UPI001FD78CF9|nr:amidohydrolase family protein [Pararhodobacter sp. SW119]